MVQLSVTLDWADLAVASTAILGLSGVVGLLIRFGLVPYLRTELIEPAQQTNQIVTGGDEAPDVRELVDQLATKQDELSGEIEDATLELRAMAMMFDGHIEWAGAEAQLIRHERQQIVDEIWAELNRQRDAGLRPPAPGRHRRKDTNDENQA